MLNATFSVIFKTLWRRGSHNFMELMNVCTWTQVKNVTCMIMQLILTSIMSSYTRHVFSWLMHKLSNFLLQKHSSLLLLLVWKTFVTEKEIVIIANKMVCIFAQKKTLRTANHSGNWLTSSVTVKSWWRISECCAAIAKKSRAKEMNSIGTQRRRKKPFYESHERKW